MGEIQQLSLAVAYLFHIHTLHRFYVHSYLFKIWSSFLLLLALFTLSIPCLIKLSSGVEFQRLTIIMHPFRLCNDTKLHFTFRRKGMTASKTARLSCIVLLYIVDIVFPNHPSLSGSLEFHTLSCGLKHLIHLYVALEY